MFYCESCRTDKGYPGSITYSYGKCEICGDNCRCHNVPSSEITLPKVTSRYQKSRQILDKLSTKAVDILSNPGKLRDKWPLLSEDDRGILEEAIEEMSKEAKELSELLAKTEENSNEMVK